MSIEERIEAVLDAEIRPMVSSHGGGVRLASFENGIAYVELSGACAGCPSADFSTKAEIEDALRNTVPEVESVEIDFTIPEDMLALARKILSGQMKDGNE